MTVREKLEAKYGKASTTSDISSGSVRARLEAKYKPTDVQPTGNKFTQFASGVGKVLETGAEFTVNPIGRALERPFYETYAGIQQMRGKEIPQFITPFGKITPRKFGETKGLEESAFETVDVALTALPVEKLVMPIAKFFGGMTKRFGGALTGKGLEVIDEIIANPEIAKQGLRGDEISVLKNTALKAKNTVSSLRKQMQQGYADMIKGLPKEGSLNYIPLTKKGLRTFITDNLRQFNVLVDRKKQILDFTETPLRKSEENVLREVFDVVERWKDLTPSGVDRLAIKIGNYVKTGEQSGALNTIVSGIKKDIRSYIGNRYPQISKAVGEYAQNADKIETLENILKVSPLNNTKQVLDTAKKIQGLFKGDKQLERELLKQMGLGDIVATEAGRQLAQAPSRAASSIGDMTKNIIQTVIPPKVIGEIAAVTGIAKPKIQSVMTVIQKLAPLERTTFFNTITKIFGNQETR